MTSSFRLAGATTAHVVLALATFGLLVQAQEGGERSSPSQPTNTPSARRASRCSRTISYASRFSTDDIPHSFTIDGYRIAKRVEPGKPIVFEFRADQPGRFPIYCNLSADERCKKMVGELIVEARK